MPKLSPKHCAMAPLICAALALFLCPHSAAQSHSHGYVWAGPGIVSGDGISSRTSVWALALGGEAVFKQNFGVGAEAGGLGSTGLGTGAGLVSVNGYYHIPRDNPRFDPFLTGGYSVTVPYGIGLANVGGGVNWWFSRHVGLKVLIRDYLVVSGFDKGNVASFGFGVGFR